MNERDTLAYTERDLDYAYTDGLTVAREETKDEIKKLKLELSLIVAERAGLLSREADDGKEPDLLIMDWQAARQLAEHYRVHLEAIRNVTAHSVSDGQAAEKAHRIACMAIGEEQP
jgi:hypothetical protein